MGTCGDSPATAAWLPSSASSPPASSTAVHPDAKKASEAIVRSMGRPQATGFRESLRRSMYPVEIQEVLQTLDELPQKVERALALASHLTSS